MKTKLALAISTALFANSVYATDMQKEHTPELTSVESHKKPSSISKVKHKSTQRFIIELKQQPLAFEKSIPTLSSSATKKMNLTSNQAKSYRSLIEKQQAQLISQLSSMMPSAKVEKSFSTLFNGITIAANNVDIERITSLPNVKAVYPERMYYTSADASLDLINAPEVWQQLSGVENAGTGIRVAIIDSGIRPENPMFSGEGFTKPVEAMPNNDYCSTVDPTFCNNKLIVARWSQPTFPVCEDEYMSPLGYGGHGTHVAGTAVGNKVTTEYQNNEVEISGVAPAAYLMAYKALYSGQECGGSSGSNIMLMEALEHAVNDGADVINNSWGGGYGASPETSPYKSMFEAAEEAGVVVVSAAGNDGNSAKTIGCPGCIESGITVANSTTGRYFANQVEFNGEQFLAIEGNNEKIADEDIELPVISATQVNVDNFEACDDFAADSFKDSIALVSRGTCAFADKAENVMAAGAKAMVVYNNRAGAPITMHMPDAEIPSVMVSQKTGEQLLSGLTDEQNTLLIGAETVRTISPELADTINPSSSRGPNGDENILKPDLAAPGTNILSAYSPDVGSGDNFNAISGTSMASPHVAGAAALMSQMHPDWSASDIKTALTSTSKVDGILDDDAETPATPFAMGAGRLDLEAASKAVLTFDKPSIASDSCVINCTFSRTVYNKSDETTEWTLSVQSSGGTVFSVEPETLVLESGASAEIKVTADTTYADDSSWVFGHLLLNSDAGLQNAHLPIAIRAKESSDTNLISVSPVDSAITTAKPFTVKNVINNTEFDRTVTVVATAPEGTSLTSEEDVKINVSSGRQNGAEINTELNRITWVGNLNIPEMSLRNTGGLPSVIDALNLEPISCNGCDEVATTFTVPSFKYNGETYESITISDNGLIIVGGGNTSGTWNNRTIPNDIQPNNILAPFWSDFDLHDGTSSDTGNGEFAIALFTLSGERWLAVEWKDAALWGDTSGNTYSFATWIKVGESEEIIFNYIDIPNMPEAVTIGAENAAGNIGVQHYYEGEGTAVSSDSALTLSATPAGKLEIEYTAKLNDDASTTGSAVEMNTAEETAVEVTPAANEYSTTKVAKLNITGSGNTARAQKVLPITSSGELSELAIATEPQNGQVEVSENGTLSYTPNKDFFGEDSFEYTAKDAAEYAIAPTKVKVMVTNVNDAPEVTADNVEGYTGETVTLTANGTDVDNDSLTYTWEQTAGTNVEFTQNENSINFTAPTEATTLTFSVVADDGVVKTDAVEVTATTTVRPEAPEPESSSSSGSLGWLALILAPMAFLRRRNK